jgi:hypothetical protein
MKQYEQKQMIKNWYFKKHHRSLWDAFQDLNKLAEKFCSFLMNNIKQNEFQATF